jgi:acetylornithine deacetylase/succinyl-diaminopimelate desuccinylase-like protein
MMDQLAFDEKAYTEAQGYLSAFIQIKSVNPPGREWPALVFLKSILEKEGLQARLYQTAPERGVLVFCLEGKDPAARSVVLMNHVDVVPAEAEFWDHDPFGGEVVDGAIWGRGALDMKSFGIMQLAVMLAFARKEIQPQRPLVFLAVSDEERNGKDGAQWVVEHLLAEIDPEVIFTEGAYGLERVLIKEPVFCVEVAQKSSLKVKVTAVDQPGHGNAPGKRSAIINLSKALGRLADYDFPILIHPVTAELFRRMAVKKSFPENWLMRNLANPVARWILGRALSRDKTLNAHLRNTVSITALKAGEGLNVIPPTAEAVIDLRYMPGEDPQQVLKTIAAVLEEETITLEPSAEGLPNYATDFHTPFFKIIEEEILKVYPQSVVAPYLDIGGTDSKHFRIKGIPCYGIVPIIITQEELQTIHGNNERIKVEAFRQGMDITLGITRRLCGL